MPAQRIVTARALLSCTAVLLAALAACSSDEPTPAGPTITTGSGGSGAAAGSGGSGGGDGGTAGSGGEVAAMGPLTVHPDNRRYFADASGAPVYVASTYSGNTLQDQGDVGVLDWAGYVDLLAEHDLNLAKYVIRDRVRNNGAISPTLYLRTGPGEAVDGGPKLDLTQLNPEFVDQLRERTLELQNRGIYVVVMFFNRFDIVDGENNWDASAYHADNNVNGIDGDTNGDGEGKEVQSLPLASDIEAIQRTRIRAIIDAVNEFDNVIYEVCNETYGDTAWQQWVADEIRAYEATLPKHHLVGQTATWPDGSNAELRASSADWISPKRANDGDGNYEDDPPVEDGTKIVIVDSDHVTAGEVCTAHQAWMYFARGSNPMCYEGWEVVREATHDAMGHTRSYAARMDLAAVVPDESLSSTGYCLANPGSEYLAYQPGSGAFSVDVEAGTYDYEWFDITAGAVQEQGSLNASGGALDLTPPFGGSAVVYLTASEL